MGNQKNQQRKKRSVKLKVSTPPPATQSKTSPSPPKPRPAYFSAKLQRFLVEAGMKLDSQQMAKLVSDIKTQAASQATEETNQESESGAGADSLGSGSDASGGADLNMVSYALRELLSDAEVEADPEANYGVDKEAEEGEDEVEPESEDLPEVFFDATPSRRSWTPGLSETDEALCNSHPSTGGKRVPEPKKGSSGGASKPGSKKAGKSSKSGGKHRATADDTDDDTDTPISEPYKIAFKVPYGLDTKREVQIWSTAPWRSAQQEFALKMNCKPDLIRLAYVLPWEQKGSKKVAPTLLQDENEWDSLLNHIDGHIQTEKAKSRGKGAVKPFSISLQTVDDNGAASLPSTGSSSKMPSGPPSTSISLPTSKADDALKQTGAIVDDLKARHYCGACQEPCIVLPPREHRVLTIKALAKWANLIRNREATPTTFPKQLIPDLGLPKENPEPSPATPSTPPRRAMSESSVVPGAAAAAANTAVTAPSSLATAIPPAPSTPLPPAAVLQALAALVSPQMLPLLSSPLAGVMGASSAIPSIPINPYTATALPLTYPTPPFPHVPTIFSQYTMAPPAPGTPSAHQPAPVSHLHGGPVTPRRHNRSPARTTPSHRRRDQSPNRPGDSDYGVEYPSLGDWLLDLDAHPRRGQDGQQYADWTDRFYELSFIRLNDLTDTFELSPDRLISLIPGMEYATASRLLRWAAEDKIWYDKQVPPRKQRRYY